MQLANASLLDESTAAAEGNTFLDSFFNSKIKKLGANKFFVHDQILPQTLSVLKTRATPLEIELIVGLAPPAANDEYYGAIVQYPGKHGQVYDFRRLQKNSN